MKENPISDLFTNLNSRPEIRTLIPMGYTPGIPVLTVRQDNLCLTVPYLRYKITGEKDGTLVFPVRYYVTYLVPENIPVQFVDLAYTPIASKIDFNKPVGRFRHEAIANLDREGYNALRRETLASLDTLALGMLGEIDEDHEAELKLGRQLKKIVEPSLYPFYRLLAPDFFKTYIGNGKN